MGGGWGWVENEIRDGILVSTGIGSVGMGEVVWVDYRLVTGVESMDGVAEGDRDD